MAERKAARLKAMELLTARDYTERQLAEKLEQKEYTEEEVREALDYVKSFHYVDDARFASHYLEYHKDSRSYRRMEQDLSRRGIPPEVVRECWEEMLGRGAEYDEGELIRRELRRRRFDLQEADYRERQKAAAFLYRKGFSAEAIRKYLVLDTP